MASRDKKLQKAWSGRAGKVRKLSDLNRHSLNSDSDSDDDPHQNSYTGGGQKSRKLDKEPSKSNDVDAIFNEAKQVGDLERLLSGETAHQHQPPPAAAAHNIVFWSNGFTVDDGPLRNLDDPQNAPFLESIKKSECPKELEPVDGRSSVNVNLIRRNDKYTEPEKPHVLVPFQGVGRTLGVRGNSSTPTSTSGVVEATATSPAGDPTPTPFAGVEMVVDESLPSTSIQLRLADGTRLISRFNYNHRVSDIRAIDASSRPEGGGGRNYELQMVGFPPTILTDETQTIEQAGLANSVVIQKF